MSGALDSRLSRNSRLRVAQRTQSASWWPRTDGHGKMGPTSRCQIFGVPVPTRSGASSGQARQMGWQCSELRLGVVLSAGGPWSSQLRRLTTVDRNSRGFPRPLMWGSRRRAGKKINAARHGQPPPGFGGWTLRAAALTFSLLSSLLTGCTRGRPGAGLAMVVQTECRWRLSLDRNCKPMIGIGDDVAGVCRQASALPLGTPRLRLPRPKLAERLLSPSPTLSGTVSMCHSPQTIERKIRRLRSERSPRLPRKLPTGVSVQIKGTRGRNTPPLGFSVRRVPRGTFNCATIAVEGVSSGTATGEHSTYPSGRRLIR